MSRFLIVAALLFVAVSADSVKFKSCREPAPNCVVNSLTIDPCGEAASNSPCKFKRGKSAHMTVEVTPDFDTEKADAKWYWENGNTDLPLMGVETDACKSIDCPVKKGLKTTYNFDLDINRRWPLQTFDIKWRLTGDTPDKECCFVTAIKISR